MKDALQVLDFDDPSSEPLKFILLQCYVTPIVLKTDQVTIISLFHTNCYICIIILLYLHNYNYFDCYY